MALGSAWFVQAPARARECFGLWMARLRGAASSSAAGSTPRWARTTSRTVPPVPVPAAETPSRRRRRRIGTLTRWRNRERRQERRKFALALFGSVVVHLMLLALQFDEQGLGLPGRGVPTQAAIASPATVLSVRLASTELRLAERAMESAAIAPTLTSSVDARPAATSPTDRPQAPRTANVRPTVVTVSSSRAGRDPPTRERALAASRVALAPRLPVQGVDAGDEALAGRAVIALERS
ncbi:MAG TPA: hypothetical protein VMT92_07565, partial [Steroidobacteraceae bacterium]|nr:hypothetical protein [Steroidobacteraceae bacterium]